MFHTRIYDAAGDTTGFWYGPAEWELVSESRSTINFRKTFSNGETTTFKILGDFNTSTNSGRFVEMKEIYRGKVHFSIKVDEPARTEYFSDGWEVNARDWYGNLRDGIEGIGNRYANTIGGYLSDDRLLGLGGNDRLFGYEGNDLLDGATGADRMEGGTGHDTCVVDNTGDRLVEFQGEGTDLVVSSIGFRLPSFFENLTLAGAAAINGSGNELRNVLRGNKAANVLEGESGSDTLFGGDGDDRLDGGSDGDRMTGGRGNDIYHVDDRGDRVIESVGEGRDTVYSQRGFKLPGGVENLTLTGAASIDGTGNALKNMLTGNSGANRLDGDAGADSMRGGFGDDLYIVDNTGDRIVENSNAGADLVRSSVSFTLSRNVENLTLTGSAAIGGKGNGGDNELRGNAAANALDGAGGNDRLTGGRGPDDLTGGTGADVFAFGSVADTPAGAGDAITDFQIGIDLADLSAIDADQSTDGDQAFLFIGGSAFSGSAGELRYAAGTVEGDVDGDGSADLEIAIANLVALTADDFVL